jgi:methionyl-tRNA formyltransferase
MDNIKVVFMGTPVFAAPILEGLINNYNVIGVVTQPDKETGRNKEVTHSPIKKIALENNIKVLQPVRVRKEYEDIINLNPDIIITCAYGQIIPKILLDAPRLGCVNVHASLLPKLRGGAPIHRAIINGYEKTGITIMYMDEHMDTGDIISKKEIDITINMTTGDLHDTLSEMGRDLLLETLPSIIEGTNNRVKQKEEEVTFARLLNREDEHIDFSQNTLDVHNQIRGLSPYPGSYTIFKNKVMKVYNSKIDSKNKLDIPGKIIDISKDGLTVCTKDGTILVTDIKIDGKKRMDVKDYLNGINKEDIIGNILE